MLLNEDRLEARIDELSKEIVQLKLNQAAKPVKPLALSAADKANMEALL